MPASAFKDKYLTLIVATRPVGYYDRCARAIAPFLEKYLPVKGVAIRNIPGRGMITGANEIYCAPADGLTIGTFNSGLLTAQLAGVEGIRFDLNRFTWLANAVLTPRLLAVRPDLPHRTIGAIRKSNFPLKIPSSGVGGSAYNDGMLLKEVLGLNLIVIPEYGGARTTQALRQGAVNGRIGSYAAVMQDVEAGLLRPVLQWGEQLADLAAVPVLAEQAPAAAKKLVALMDAMAAAGRPFAAPPGVPAEQRALLRRAFADVLHDSRFLEVAAKARLPIQYQSGAELQRMIAAALDQDAETAGALKRILK